MLLLLLYIFPVSCQTALSCGSISHLALWLHHFLQ